MEEYLKSTKHIVNAFKPPLLSGNNTTVVSTTIKPKNDNNTTYKVVDLSTQSQLFQMPYYSSDGQVLYFY